MREIILIVIGLYAILQAYAAVVGWRYGLIPSRGALLTMMMGSSLMLVGIGLDHPESIWGIVLIGIGLYLISDSAFYIGTKRLAGPRYSHHAVRALVGMLLVVGLVLS